MIIAITAAAPVDACDRSALARLSDNGRQCEKSSFARSEINRRIRYETTCDSTRGYGSTFAKHIRQANEGCDFDFPETGFGAPEIY